MPGDAVSVFVSYSHEDSEVRAALSKHLLALRHEGLIVDWHDGAIDAGQDWDAEIRKRLATSDLILLLVSADFLASEYCRIELAAALDRHRRGDAIVVPIIARAIDWPASLFARLEPLPRNRVPIANWPDRDVALATVVADLRRTADGIVKRKQGKRTVRDRLRQWIRPPKRPPIPAPAVVPQAVMGPLRIRLVCPTCSSGYQTTVLNAGARFKCRVCGCIETVPHELLLFGHAAAQGKVPRDVLVQVVARKLVHGDLPITSVLLLPEPSPPNNSVPGLRAEDIVEPPRLSEDADLTNAIAAARRGGRLSDLEAGLKAAVATREAAASPEAEKAADATLALASRDPTAGLAAGTMGEPDGGGSASGASRDFPFARVLILHSEQDRAMALQLVDHLLVLKLSGTLAKVDAMAAESHPGELREEDFAPYHAVIVVLTSGLAASPLFRQRALTKLVEQHEARNIVLLPVLGHPLIWKDLAVARLQVLPRNGTPLASWQSLDEACVNVAGDLRSALAKLPADLIVKVAERGDSETMFHLSVAYTLGAGVSRNDDKILHWMERSAAAGRDPAKMWLLGSSLQTRAPDQALRWMREAAEAGHAPACWQLAVWFDTGTCIARDDGAAFHWCLQAAEAGHTEAMFFIAGKYMEGIGTSPDPGQAVAWLTRAAESGYPLAMVHLGNCYRVGRGVDIDHDAAGRWWQRAAASGDPAAADVLRQQGFL